MEVAAEGKSWIERWALICLAGINIIVVPCVGWLVATDVRDTLAVAQTELASASTRLAEFELQSREASAELQHSITLSNQITAKDAVVSAIEKTMPSLEIVTNVEELESSYKFHFEIKNTSAVSVTCDRPNVYLNRGAWEGRSNGEKSLFRKGAYPSYPGVLSPGASYRTSWATPDRKGSYWANFSGKCSPLEFRTSAITEMAARAGIDLKDSIFEFQFNRWYSAR